MITPAIYRSTFRTLAPCGKRLGGVTTPASKRHTIAAAEVKQTGIVDYPLTVRIRRLVSATWLVVRRRLEGPADQSILAPIDKNIARLVGPDDVFAIRIGAVDGDVCVSAYDVGAMRVGAVGEDDRVGDAGPVGPDVDFRAAVRAAVPLVGARARAHEGILPIIE